MLANLIVMMTHDLKHYLWGVLFFTSFCSTSNLLADDCNILQLQKSHTPGLNVTNNYCSNPVALSPESIIEMQGGTRLWLETAGFEQNAANFQIICQNQEATPIKLQFAKKIMPWIEPIGLSNCREWDGDNRLTCYSAGRQLTALLCVIAQKPDMSTIREIQPKTSVTLRSPHKPEISPAVDTSKWANFAKPNIDLCRKISHSLQTITINWTIKSSTGKVSATTAPRASMLSVDKQFAACALEAIENTDFPSVDHDIYLSSTF